MDRTHLEAWFTATGRNGGQDVGQSNEGMKAPANAQQHHKQWLRHFEERRRRQKHLVEEFVTDLPIWQKCKEEERRERTNLHRCQQQWQLLTTLAMLMSPLHDIASTTEHNSSLTNLQNDHYTTTLHYSWPMANNNLFQYHRNPAVSTAIVKCHLPVCTLRTSLEDTSTTEVQRVIWSFWISWNTRWFLQCSTCVARNI